MSQFEKRRAKADKALKSKVTQNSELAKELASPIEQSVETLLVEDSIPAVVTESVMYEGYDIFLTPDKRGYNLVIFKYDPYNNKIEIEKIQKIDRGLALSFEQRKKALKTLIRRT